MDSNGNRREAAQIHADIWVVQWRLPWLGFVREMNPQKLKFHVFLLVDSGLKIYVQF